MLYDYSIKETKCTIHASSRGTGTNQWKNELHEGAMDYVGPAVHYRVSD